MRMRGWFAGLCLTCCGWGFGSDTAEPGANTFLVGITSLELYQNCRTTQGRSDVIGSYEPTSGLTLGMELTGRDDVIIIGVSDPTVTEAVTSTGEVLTAASGGSVARWEVSDPTNPHHGSPTITFKTNLPQREAVSLKRFVGKATISYTDRSELKSIEIKPVVGKDETVTAFPDCDLTIGKNQDGGIVCAYGKDISMVIRSMTFLDADGQTCHNSSTSSTSSPANRKITYGSFNKPVVTVVLEGYATRKSVRATIELKSLPLVGTIPQTLISAHPVHAVEAIMPDPSQPANEPKTP